MKKFLTDPTFLTLSALLIASILLFLNLVKMHDISCNYESLKKDLSNVHEDVVLNKELISKNKSMIETNFLKLKEIEELEKK